MKRLTAKIVDTGPLTPKEAEILRYLCEGHFRLEIAMKLHRTLSTVSKHIEHIAEKLEAHSTTEIVLIAQQMGLVEIRLNPNRSAALQCFLVFIAIANLLNPMANNRTPRTPRTASSRISARRFQEDL